jgi:hypothetical protein
MAGCRLDRDTDMVLKAIGDVNGGWKSIELERKAMSEVLPFVLGEFIKK